MASTAATQTDELAAEDPIAKDLTIAELQKQVAVLQKQVAVLQKELVSENPVPACHECEVMITKLLVEADGKDEMNAIIEKMKAEFFSLTACDDDGTPRWELMGFQRKCWNCDAAYMQKETWEDEIEMYLDDSTDYNDIEAIYKKIVDPNEKNGDCLCVNCCEEVKDGDPNDIVAAKKKQLADPGVLAAARTVERLMKEAADAELERDEALKKLAVALEQLAVKENSVQVNPQPQAQALFGNLPGIDFPLYCEEMGRAEAGDAQFSADGLDRWIVHNYGYECTWTLLPLTDEERGREWPLLIATFPNFRVDTGEGDERVGIAIVIKPDSESESEARQ